MFKILFKKNLLYWRRSWIGSAIELLLPLSLLSILAYLINIIDITNFPEKSYNPIEFTTNTNPSKFPPNYIPSKFMKNCKNLQTGGLAAFAPRNDLTENLSNYFKSLKTETIFFKSDSEIDNYISSADYGTQYKNGTYKRLCLAISFDTYNKEKIEYNYNLRFNISASPLDVDHYMTYYNSRKIPFKPDDDAQFKRDIAHGVLTTQVLVESFLLKKHVPGLEGKMSLRKMHTPDYSFSNVIFTEGAVTFVFLLSGIIIYLRTIAYIVAERENRNIQNLENMGVQKYSYFLAIIASNMSVHCVFGVVFCLLLKHGSLRHTSFFVLYFAYVTFIFVMLTLGMVLSTFFINSKKAIIYSIVFFFLLEVPYMLRNNIKEYGENYMFYASFSPVMGIGQLIYNVLSAETSALEFNFHSLYNEELYFKAINFFYISIFEIIIFVFLSIYLFYVMPLGIGVPSHPLFFLGYPFKKEQKEEEIQKKNLEENLLPKENLENNENFEKIPEDLKKQIKNNKTISINNLTKIYSSNPTLKAVNNLNLNIFTNQIFALLGHNGAGKTTTISMISGLIKKSSGTIKILGNDTSTSRSEIKKILGVCTQHNPIFPYMTVREHLKLYAKIKGVTKDINSEIEEVLKDIDLFHKIDYKAKLLSGGQKRKLSVAIAFIGGSKVILLDEPTSGMDAQARRLLWNMIKKYKEGRLIILTTHNMDEADNLGDRIAIMSQGKILTCGSSLFLKKKFGTGYELTVVKSEGNGEEQDKRICEEVLEVCKNSRFVMDFGQELKFKLSDLDSKCFKDLFERLERKKEVEDSGVSGFGISLTTLEEVFLKVNNLDKENDDKIVKEDEKAEKNDIVEQSTLVIKEDIKLKTLDQLRYSSNSIIFFNQFVALIKKRFIFFSRDIGSLMCQIFIPIFLILIAFAFTKINFIPNAQTLDMSTSIYSNNFKINNLNTITSKIVSNFDFQNPKPEIFQSQNEENFDSQTFENRSENQNFAFYLNTISQNNYDFTIFQNSTAPFSQYYATTALHNSLIKYYTNKNTAKINMNLKPLPLTSKIKNLEGTIDGFILVSFISLAFVLIPSSMIIFIIKERENNAKHQQLISGVNVFAYWLSNFLVDFVNYLIPSMVFFVLFYVFDTSFFIEKDHGAMSFCLFLLNGVTMVLSVYFFSFLFKSPGKGQVFIFLYVYFFATFLVILSFVLRVIPSTSDLTVNYLEFIFRCFPPFSYSYAMLNLSNLKFYQLVFQWDEIPKAFEKRGALWEFIYLSVEAVVLFILVFLIEFSYKLAFLLKKKTINQNKLENKEEKDDKKIHFLDEEKNLKENKSLIEEKNPESIEDKNSDIIEPDVKIENLTKVYNTKSLLSCSKSSKKQAIKGISFTMKPGTIFGLLGTNGAGKTSTFKILTGDIFPTSGNAYIKSKKMPHNILQIRKYLGYCPQFDTILDNLTAKEHLSLYANIKGIQKKYHNDLITEMLTRMNLQKYANIKSKEFSGGNKRKLSVAISLLGGPSIILLDEPSAGMDPESRSFMWRIINGMSTVSKNSSILLTTHSMEEAEALATHIAIMVEGRIVTQGTVQELKDEFGKNFEVDLKFVFPSEEFYERERKVILEGLGCESVAFLDKERCLGILKVLGKEYLVQEFLGKKGEVILEEILKNEFIRYEEYMQWVFFMDKLKNTFEFLEKFFEISLLEYYSSYCRIQISQKNKLSMIFDKLESHQEELGIMNYSLKQISLEQIFINLANNIKHDD